MLNKTEKEQICRDAVEEMLESILYRAAEVTANGEPVGIDKAFNEVLTKFGFD